MLTLESIRSGPYESAERVPKFTFEEAFKVCLQVLFGLLKVIVLSVPILIDSLKVLFLGRKKKSIQNWTALVTGGANGIGRATATELCKHGCNVAIADIDGSAAKLAAEELQEEFKVKVVGYEIDISNYKVLPKLKEDIENDIGIVDILVNNAGMMPISSILDGSSEQIEKIVAVNITAHFHMVRMFLDGMLKKRRGHIVTIASMAAFHPLARGVVYTSSKYAVTGFADALEQELRSEGFENDISFTTVFPYFVATRKDLMSSLNLMVPALTPEQTGKGIVNGILRNDHYVYMPSTCCVTPILANIIPYRVQNLIRDHVFREQDCVIKPKQPSYVTK